MEAEQVSSLASLLVHSASMSIIASEEEVSWPGEGGPAHTMPLLLSPFSSSTIGFDIWGGKVNTSSLTDQIYFHKPD